METSPVPAYRSTPTQIWQLHPVGWSASERHVWFRSWHCLNPSMPLWLRVLRAQPPWVIRSRVGFWDLASCLPVRDAAKSRLLVWWASSPSNHLIDQLQKQHSVWLSLLPTRLLSPWSLCSAVGAILATLISRAPLWSRLPHSIQPSRGVGANWRPTAPRGTP